MATKFKLEQNTIDFTGHALALYSNDEQVYFFSQARLQKFLSEFIRCEQYYQYTGKLGYGQADTMYSGTVLRVGWVISIDASENAQNACKT